MCGPYIQVNMLKYSNIRWDREVYGEGILASWSNSPIAKYVIKGSPFLVGPSFPDESIMPCNRLDYDGGVAYWVGWVGTFYSRAVVGIKNGVVTEMVVV